MKTHPLDKTLALAHSDIRVGLFTGATSPDYWNMVGPFGGTGTRSRSRTGRWK